jgi:tetratricopeptide (TPR) repeat protein/serine/threonine protein kinase
MELVAVYRTSAGKTLTVGEKLAWGGQGEIYAVTSSPEVVFKKYLPRALADDPTLERRLATMTARPPAQWREPGTGHVTLAWPTETVSEYGRFAGFLMPAIDTDTTVHLHRVTNPSDRRKATGRTDWTQRFTWQYLLRTAANLAYATRLLHDIGVVIGDFNESNIRVTHQARVTLLDCDSMQVIDPVTTQRYFCPVGRAEFTPPELLNADWKSTFRHPTSDLYALAIHLYQLLLEGEHPFRGIWAGAGEKPHEPELAHSGIWAQQAVGPLSPRPKSIPIGTLLPPDIVELFRRAFEDGATNPTARPTAEQWHRALTTLEATLVTCSVNASHAYPGTLRGCPWCRHAASSGQRPLPALKVPPAQRVVSSPLAPSPPTRAQQKAARKADNGDSLSGRGRYARAESAYRAAIAADPQLLRAHLGLATALCNLGRYQEGERAARDAVRLDATAARAHGVLGRALIALKRYEDAETSIRKAISLDSSVASYHANLAFALNECKQYAKAINECRTAIGLDPGLGHAYSHLGFALGMLGQAREAETACRTAIDLNPGLAAAHSNLGYALIAQDRYLLAAKACRDAIKLDPALARAHGYLGAALFGEEQFAPAERECRNAIRLDPAMALAYLFLSYSLYAQAQHQDAAAFYRKAVQLEPEYRKMRYQYLRGASWLVGRFGS